MSDQKDKKLIWEEISTEHIIQDEWIDFRRHVYRMPDGSVFEPYYSYSRRDYVVIVAIDEEGKLPLVRQFRQGIREVTNEFPAGGIEKNGTKNYRDGMLKESKEDEGILEAAKRELLEETGYVSDKWTHLMTFPSNATIEDNYAIIYLAEHCRKMQDQDLDDTEFLQVILKTPDEIDELIEKGQFQQAVHILAWMLCKNHLKRQ